MKNNTHAPLLTTTVGSFPKPAYLLKARQQYASGTIDYTALHELEKKATAEVIALQEEIGLDILVHGEMERGDMATYFAEHLEGFEISSPVRSYGNRYYRKPIVKGKITRPKPITVALFSYTQSLTEKPVKGMLTGPYTMCDWSFNKYYRNRRDLVMALAEVIGAEARDLQDAGARYIQIDEPAISTRPAELDLAIEAMAVVTAGLTAKTISHICYGDFAPIYPRLLDLPVDQFDLEFANSDFSNIDVFSSPPFTKEIAVGVIDIHSHNLETKEQVKQRIYRALKAFPPDKVYIDPDCGLKTRTWEETRDKLTVMMAAVREVRRELRGVTHEASVSG
ncbi:MAG: methionine synthase [candidate division Zixibacteria bacterium]|nr:methionine synthase [candidate division Zixibacteria bacterium]